MSNMEKQVKIEEMQVSSNLCPGSSKKQSQIEEDEDVGSFRAGHWNEAENMKYLMFIEYHNEKMRRRENRRLWKIFKIMSNFIKTRRPSQCRSHHKKMEAHFKSIASIIQYHKNKIPNYQEHYLQIMPALESISFGIQIKNHQTLIQEENQQMFLIPKPTQNQLPSLLPLGKTHHTSIKLPEIIQLNSLKSTKNQELPATDQSIHPDQNIEPKKCNHSSEIQSFLESEKPLHFDNPINTNYLIPNNETMLQFSFQPNLYQQNFINAQPFHQNTQPFRQNGQLFHQSELHEWLECQHLYWIWKSKLQELLKKQSAKNAMNDAE